MTEGFTVGVPCQVMCAKVVSIFTFLSDFASLICLQYHSFAVSPQKEYDEDANEVCIESKHVDWGLFSGFCNCGGNSARFQE